MFDLFYPQCPKPTFDLFLTCILTYTLTKFRGSGPFRRVFCDSQHWSCVKVSLPWVVYRLDLQSGFGGFSSPPRPRYEASSRTGKSRKGSTCFNFQGLGAQWLQRLVVCTKRLQMPLEVLQFPEVLAHNGSIAGSKCFNCQGRGFNVLIPKFCVHHWSAGRLYRLCSKNGRSGQISIQTCATPLVNKPRLLLQHIPGEDEYRACINMHLNIICITFRLDGIRGLSAENKCAYF